MQTDVVIVGSGVSGLISALEIDSRKKVILLTKNLLEKSNSYLAQGGISALLDENDRKTYIDDTMKAGHFKNDLKAVEVLVDRSQDAIETLKKYRVRFSRDEKGSLLLTKEGAHSVKRIRYCEDQTGKFIMEALISEVKKRGNTKIYENTKAVDLLIRDNICYGISAENKKGKFNIYARDTILATGGLGGLFENTTNFSHICGDGIGFAIKNNLSLKDISYIQIHPTALYEKNKERKFLISESVRGEGAFLRNHKKERFTDELQPRDVVAKAILREMEKEKVSHEFIDFRPIRVDIEKRFPNIVTYLKEIGYDPRKDLIPIVPAVHYTMGGIKVDLNSKTDTEHLYAVGEVSCTGVHGKNRLASNSLLESVVFGKRCAQAINEDESYLKRYEEMTWSSIDFGKMKEEIEIRIKEDEKAKTL